MSRTNTICPFCGVGCGISLLARDNKVIQVEPMANHPVSQGKLCAKGWNSAFGITHSGRLTQPLMKVSGKFEAVSWERALSHIADKLSYFKNHFGPQSVGVISSARATNEDNYAAQKFARAVLKTNNVDHCARICHSPSVAGLKRTLGSGAMTNSIDDVAKADVILVVGADPTENHAIIGGHIIEAKNRGAKLIVIDPRLTRLAKLADIHLQLKIGTNIALLNGLINIIFEHQWQNNEFLQKRCEGTQQLKQHVAQYTLKYVSETTGVKGQDLIAAAKLYSQANAAFLAYGMGITQFVSGTDNVMGVSNLALVCGQIGRQGTGINPLRGQNNVQGACDMGCLPNVYPGYQSSTDPAVMRKFSKAWETDVASEVGLTSLGMNKKARDNQFKGLLIFGEDPVVTDPDRTQVSQGLEQMELVVVVELSMTETAKMADVVLPAASFAEKSGTFTNCERRVQYVRKAVEPPGQAKADWQILAELAQTMGAGEVMNWQSSEQVFDEMAELTDSYSGMNYAAIISHNGLQWPCNQDNPHGSRILHSHQFPLGKGQLIVVDQVQPIEQPDQQYPFWFTTMRLHFHYGCGSMTRKSPLLERETSSGLLFMHPQDLRDYGFHNNQSVAVTSRRGRVETRIVESDQVVPGLVSMPYHFKEAPSNLLTNDAMDEVTEMPELKACAVAITPLQDNRNPTPSTLAETQTEEATDV